MQVVNYVVDCYYCDLTDYKQLILSVWSTYNTHCIFELLT